ncbi:hypothetical protein TNCV_2649121 [Trichonephila clavipes]|nr:hypothetical protein TNCV_2649121 [Trichonephila clavipes]
MAAAEAVGFKDRSVTLRSSNGEAATEKGVESVEKKLVRDQGACNHLGFVRVRVCDPALAIKGVNWGLLLSQLFRHFPEGSVVGVESSKFVLPGLVLEGFDLPVYSVLNVVQHSLVARISRELPDFSGSVPFDHELTDLFRNVVGIPTSNRLGRECVCVYDRVGEVGNLCVDVFPRARSDWVKSVVGGA